MAPRIRPLILFVWFIPLWLTAGCAKGRSVANDPPAKPSIVVSVPPYLSVVKAIAGGTVDVRTATPPGFDPHSEEITPNRTALLHTCRLWIGIGEPYEARILASLKGATPPFGILRLNQTVSLLPYPAEVDPDDRSRESVPPLDLHFWMSPELLIRHAKEIAKALITLFAEHAETYRRNLTFYLSQIEALDAVCRAKLMNHKGANVIVSHPFLGYFCREYELKQLAVEGEGKEVRIRGLIDLLTRADETGVACVLITPGHNDRGARRIAKMLHRHPVLIDPLAEDPLHTIRQVTDAVTHAK
ncbi:MAG: zinc ABC transporter substrate-binding protein [Simkaniaceae bacterium]|nr:zinc ABC transporter substrate-binding protein [Simkaniaceae bacterium]